MAMKPIYLTEEEEKQVAQFAKNGMHNAQLINRANILLMLNRTGKKDHMRIKIAADSFSVSRQTIYNIIEDYHNSKDISDFLSRKVRKTSPIPAKVDGELEAHIIALACSKAPEGYSRWTLKLLSTKAVELGFVDSTSPMTIQRLLKKRNISLTNSKDISDFLSRKARKNPPIPAKVDGELEAHIIALACSKAPEGYSRWTLRLLSTKAVELGFVGSTSPMTIQRLLKKRNISLT